MAPVVVVRGSRKETALLVWAGACPRDVMILDLEASGAFPPPATRTKATFRVWVLRQAGICCGVQPFSGSLGGKWMNGLNH